MEHNEEEQDLYNYVVAGCSAPHRAFTSMSAVWKAKQHKPVRKENIPMNRKNSVDLNGSQKFVIAYVDAAWPEPTLTQDKPPSNAATLFSKTSLVGFIIRV